MHNNVNANSDCDDGDDDSGGGGDYDDDRDNDHDHGIDDNGLSMMKLQLSKWKRGIEEKEMVIKDLEYKLAAAKKSRDDYMVIHAAKTPPPPCLARLPVIISFSPPRRIFSESRCASRIGCPDSLPLNGTHILLPDELSFCYAPTHLPMIRCRAGGAQDQGRTALEDCGAS